VVYGAALEKRSRLWRAWVRIPPSPLFTHWLIVSVVIVSPCGEVLEWPIRRAWRARVAFGDRGFESHPLRFFYRRLQGDC
jgi:hypothetical protein